jgi:hypothetical protein
MLKRILYVAILSPGSTCVPRLRGLQYHDLEIQTLDTSTLFGSPHRWVNSLTQRTYCTPRALQLNRALLDACRAFKPDLIWMDKAVWVYPFVLRRLRARARYIVHYNTDDIFAPGLEFWLHKRGIRLYDVYLTTNRWNVKEIAQKFKIRSLRVGMGYDRRILHSFPENIRETGAPIFFGGHWEPHTEQLLNVLQASGLPFVVRGHNWWKAREPQWRKVQPAPYLDYLRETASAKIALCIVSARNRNDSASRSFEIPALGTFMLAIRTNEHRYLYQDGVHAALFSSGQELADKARYYLSHDDVRRKIAQQGHQRCVELGLSWEEHIQREWGIINRVLHGEHIGFEDDVPFWKGFRCGDDWELE